MIVLSGIVLAIVVLVATAPHPWIGETVCTIRGGQWTNRFPQHVNETPGVVTDQIITAGRKCIAD